MAEFDPAPTRLEDVVSPVWLSAMLAQRWPGAVVREVQVVETLVTMATKVRLCLTVEGNADAPSDICIKGILTETGAPASSSIVETLFYRNVAAQVDVRVPGCLHAGINAAGTNGVIVMHDMVAAGGRFGTALAAFTPEQALDGLDQLAALHAATWQGSALYDLPWVPRFLDLFASGSVMPQQALQDLLDGERGIPLPAAIRSAEHLQRALAALAERVRGVPNCLVHGDAHAGNVYRTAEAALGIVDWQILQKGDWAQDVAYHLAAVLSPEDRRAHERALLDHYRARLKALGGPDLDRDAAWERYRAAMIYGYFLWAITRKVKLPVINEFVRRLGLAVDDLESFALVGA